WWALTLRGSRPPTFSPLPPRAGAVSFLLHFPYPSTAEAVRAAAASDGGRYPPPRPVEPGLSSPRSAGARRPLPLPGRDRPARLRAVLSYCTPPPPVLDKPGGVPEDSGGGAPEGQGE